jgi:hypothetical protein
VSSINRAIQKVSEFALHPAKRHQAHVRARFELDQLIHVAVGPKIGAQHRPKERQGTDMIAATKITDFFVRNS